MNRAPLFAAFLSVMDFLQLNMKKAFLAAVELSKRAEGKENLTCLVTEPYRYKEKIATVPPGMKIIGSKKSARAAIFHKGSNEMLPVDSLINTDCAVGLLKLKDNTVLVASVYLDITSDPVPGWLSKIVDYADSKNYILLLGMDSNSHSVLYGPETNPRGEELENFILSRGLRVENVGDTPTFQTLRQSCSIATYIDVTLSKGMSGLIKDWLVDTDFNGSDHNTISFFLEGIIDYKATKARIWDSTDWFYFKNELAKNNRHLTIPEFLNEKKVEKLLVKFYRAINNALDKASPMVYPSKKTNSFFWYKREHKQLSNEINKLYIKSVKYNNADDRQEYKEKVRIYKNKCRRDRNKSWNKLRRK